MLKQMFDLAMGRNKKRGGLASVICCCSLIICFVTTIATVLHCILGSPFTLQFGYCAGFSFLLAAIVTLLSEEV